MDWFTELGVVFQVTIVFGFAGLMFSAGMYAQSKRHHTDVMESAGRAETQRNAHLNVSEAQLAAMTGDTPLPTPPPTPSELTEMRDRIAEAMPWSARYAGRTANGAKAKVLLGWFPILTLNSMGTSVKLIDLLTKRHIEDFDHLGTQSPGRELNLVWEGDMPRVLIM